MTAFLQVLIDAFALGSLYALSALAIGLAFGIMRLINFAQGDLITIGGYALIVPSSQMVAELFIGDWPWIFMVPAIVAICAAAALLTERIAFRPVRQADPATLLITSFAVSFFIQNLILIIYTGRPKAAGIFREMTTSVALMEGLTVARIQLLTSIVAIVLLAALALFLKRTRLGVEMRAVAEDFRMARLLGVRSNRVIMVAFALSGVLAGTVALLLVTQTGVLDFRMGLFLAVYAFFATVLGGMGSLVGAAVGGYLVGGMSVVLQAYLPDDLRPYRDAFVFGIVIVLLLVRPQGLVVGRSARERV
jgi:branched-chain amino acid transport system permease protein